MADLADVILALFDRVATLDTGSPALPIAWPEQPETFVPPEDGRYLEVTFFSNRPAWEGVSSGRLDQGLLQINVVWPKNRGIVAPAAVAASIIEHFPLGRLRQHGAARVKVQRQPWAGSPIPEADKNITPITIPWSV